MRGLCDILKSVATLSPSSFCEPAQISDKDPLQCRPCLLFTFVASHLRVSFLAARPGVRSAVWNEFQMHPFKCRFLVATAFTSLSDLLFPAHGVFVAVLLLVPSLKWAISAPCVSTTVRALLFWTMLSKTIVFELPFCFCVTFRQTASRGQPCKTAETRRCRKAAKRTAAPPGFASNGGLSPWLMLTTTHGGQACSVEEGRSDRKILSPKGTEDGEGRDARHPTGDR